MYTYWDHSLGTGQKGDHLERGEAVTAVPALREKGGTFSCGS